MRRTILGLIVASLAAVSGPVLLAQANCSPVAVSLPFAVSGSLSISDCLQNGYYADKYKTPLAAGAQIHLEASAPSNTTLTWLEVRIYRWVDSGPSMGWNRVIDKTEYTPERNVLKFDFQAPYAADYMFWVSGGSSLGYYNFSVSFLNSTPGGSCVPDATSVCLQNDRFRVSATYYNPVAQQSGTFKGAKLLAGVQNPDVATFGFDSAQAIELVVRVQDVHPYGIPRYDIYYGGMTDFPYTVIVTDTLSGKFKEYRFAGGTPAGGVDRTTFTD